MKPSQQITAARRNGRLQEAYQLSVDFLAETPNDRWVQGAFGWVLIDFVKQYASGSDQPALRRYTDELGSFVVPEGDDLLAKHRERCLNAFTPIGKALEEAHILSKRGQHEDAIRIYMEVSSKNVLNDEARVAFGWELFRAIKVATVKTESGKLDERNIGRIRNYLNLYFKLDISRPDLLHSCIMQQGIKVARQGHLKFIPFLRMWNIENLRAEDYQGSRADDGKEFPPLAEDLTQLASKEACRNNTVQDLEYVMPHLKAAVKRYPHNIWLKYNMAKTYRGLNQLDQALELATVFAKEKASESWAWDLLGDLQPDLEMQLSCYAKALTCSDDDNFTSKIRLKFAHLLASRAPDEARAEVERVLQFKQRNSDRIPQEAADMAQMPWFTNATSAPTGPTFYNKYKIPAEEILFADLPWFDACLGEEVVIEREDGSKSKKRRIHVKASPIATEISVSASLPAVRGKEVGYPIRLQKETMAGARWKTTVHRIQPRPNGVINDVIGEVFGVVSGLDTKNNIVHFIVEKDLTGSFPFSKLPSKPEIGCTLAVSMVQYCTQNGFKSRVLSIAPTDEQPSTNIVKDFFENVRVNSGMGFTSNDIFIPAPLVEASGISDGDKVQGSAILSYNKTRSKWGWKAFKARHDECK